MEEAAPNPDEPLLLVREPHNPNWMSSLVELNDASLGEIVWPGTHDSGAHCEDFDYSRVVSDDRLRSWGTYILNRIGHTPRRFVGKWSRTQNLSIFEQLEHGTRFLDLRVSKCPSDGLYYIVHSFCGPSLECVLQEIVRFMSQNIKECLLIEVVPCSFVNHGELYRLIERILDRLMLRREPYGNSSPFSLKLSHLLEKGRIIVFYKLSDHMERPPPFWDSNFLYAPFIMSMEPEEKESFQLDHFTDFKCTAAVTNATPESSSRMFHFMYALTPRLSEITCSLFTPRHSDYVNPSSLEACAQKINPRLRSFLETIKKSSSNNSGGLIVTIDFIEQSELVQLVIQMNQERLRRN